MKDPAPRHRTATRWRALVLVAMAAAVLAGCDLATGTVRTATELEKAGIDNPNLNYDGGTATLDYDADANPLEAREEQDTAARIIWQHLPFRIDRIVITSDGGAFPTRREYRRSTLEEVLGPRPANLDRSVEDIARRATLVAGVVGFVVLVLIVLVVVLVVRAVRRRPAAQPAGGWGPGPGGPQPWGPPGPPQGWGQPGPPAGQQPWGSQPGYGQPPSPAWPQPPAPPPPPPPAPAPQQPGQAGAGDDWPSGAPRPDGAPGPGGAPPPQGAAPPQGAPPTQGAPPPQDAAPPQGTAPTQGAAPPEGQAPPARGPGDTQRLEPDDPAPPNPPDPPVPPG